MGKSLSSVEKLQDAIDRELSWRKQELVLIRAQVYTHPCENSVSFLLKIRSSIALLYAHWEGSIKNIAQKYLEHVFTQDRQYRELKLNFIAAAIKGKALKWMKSEKVSLHTQYLTHFSNLLDAPLHKLSADVIKTNSNLNSETLAEILTTIGIDETKFEVDYKLIDSVLVKIRNDIAHGEILKEKGFDKHRYLELHDAVLRLIETFSEQVKNAASNENYLCCVDTKLSNCLIDTPV